MARIWDPKIIRVFEPRSAYRSAAIEVWETTLLRPGTLSAATREAIAVAVSIANQCVY
jgi:alkylhydroperoxidase/carboxymuconolactone decarboxylase family protein YurZ